MTHQRSSDGRYTVETLVNIWRMSHETRTPVVTEVATGRVILALDPTWDADASWEPDGTLRLGLRHYPDGGSAAVRLDPASSLYALDGGDWRPVAELPVVLGRRASPSLDGDLTPVWASGRHIAALVASALVLLTRGCR